MRCTRWLRTDAHLELAERFVPLVTTHKSDREMTLLVKGFLSPNSDRQDYSGWAASHLRCVQRHQWSPRLYGYSWETHGLKVPWLLPDSVQVHPVAHMGATAASWAAFSSRLLLSRIAPLHPVTLAGFGVLSAAQMMANYLWACSEAHQHARELAPHLEQLGRRFCSLRVIAHSLGARLVLEALRGVQPRYRPAALHLMAPAVDAEQVSSSFLSHAVRPSGSTFVYWTPEDMVLQTAFHQLNPMHEGDALGCVGLEDCLFPNVASVDVTRHFRDTVLVHNNYKAVYPTFIANDKYTCRA